MRVGLGRTDLAEIVGRIEELTVIELVDVVAEREAILACNRMVGPPDVFVEGLRQRDAVDDATRAGIG